jgi:hypothetical protein
MGRSAEHQATVAIVFGCRRETPYVSATCGASRILRLPLAGATRGEVRYENFIAAHPSGGRASLAIFEAGKNKLH